MLITQNWKLAKVYWRFLDNCLVIWVLLIFFLITHNTALKRPVCWISLPFVVPSNSEMSCDTEKIKSPNGAKLESSGGWGKRDTEGK